MKTNQLKVLVILIFCFLGFSPVGAQTAFDPMSIAVGARALGMGRCGVAAAEDGDMLFNNPAGLAMANGFKLTSMSGNFLEDANYTVLGGIYPLGKQTALGIGYAGSYVGGIDLRDIAGTYQRKANYGSNLVFASFGKKFFNNIAFGLNLKYYFSDGTEDNNGDGRGLNLDIGYLQQGLNWLSFGLVAENLLGSNQITYYNGFSESLPTRLKAGTKFYLLGNKYESALVSPYELVVAADATLGFQQAKNITSHLGIEFAPLPYLALRAGWDQGNYTAGLSLKIAGIGFHYAYHTYGDFAGSSANYFSLTYDEKNWPSEEQPDVFWGARSTPRRPL